MTTEKDVDWRFNIWAGDSPYRMAAERADSLLGQFLRGLDRLGALERTVIIILGDHGQDDGGWHPLQSADAAITTMVLWGAGVRSGAKIPYAEHIDVSPTICALMGVNTPKSSQGRVITGALSGFNGVAEPQAYRIRELNEGFSEYRKLVAEATCALQHLTSLRRGSLHYRLDRIRQNFYDMNRFTEWPRFRTVEELLANNRAELERLRELHRIVTGS
jgi:hypothetical protein